MTAHGKAGFEASVDAEVDFQHADLCADLRIRSHFQLHQHHAHAVKQPVVVDFSVTIRMFKTIYLSGEAGNHARFVMKKDVNHIVYSIKSLQSAFVALLLDRTNLSNEPRRAQL